MEKKSIETVVSDVYKLMKDKNSSKGVDPEAEIEKFGEAMKDLMRKEFLPGERIFTSSNKLRLSAIGKPARQQWMSARNYTGEKFTAATLIKFMFGHMSEEFLLMLVRMSGHEVTDEQKRVEVGGVVGHMDCKIDGEVVDVKTASPFGFKKFQDGTMAASDSFGYVAQLKAYAHAEGVRKWSWLAMDKQNGSLALLEYDLDNENDPMYDNYNEDIVELVESVKTAVAGDEMPEQCAFPVPEGKSGNMKLPTLCSYCKYKKHCYPTLRAFAYSTGPKFLTEVKELPRVNEIDLDF